MIPLSWYLFFSGHLVLYWPVWRICPPQCGGDFDGCGTDVKCGQYQFGRFLALCDTTRVEWLSLVYFCFDGGGGRSGRWSGLDYLGLS